MSKTYRISFEKGVNTIGDKSILPEGFVTFIDNASLRSGSPRPYKAPEWQFAAPSTTTRSWSYRGRWFHSNNWQDHVGEYIGGIERVYTTEEGKYPTKTVGGTTALLGTARPKSPIGVGKSTDLTPSGLTASVAYTGNGNLPDGERLYRISAKTADGVMPPTAPVSITVTDTSHKGASVTLTWGQVPKATGYIVFQGTQTAQYRLIELPASTLSYVDNGSVTAGGDNATQFEQNQPFTYAYSYLRNVNGVFDESGLSTPSQEITAAQGRILTRDFLNDGFMDQTDEAGIALKATATASTILSSTQYPSVSLASEQMTFNKSTLVTSIHITSSTINATTMVLGQSYIIVSVGTTDYTLVGATSNTVGVTFICTGIATGTGTVSFMPITGQKYQFVGSTDPVWNNQTYEVVYIDAYHFGIKNIAVPSDGTKPVAVAATALVAGGSYTITTIGTTDFTLVGASANTVGIVFTATGAGTGTGTATPPCDVLAPTGFTIKPVLALITYTPPTYNPVPSTGSIANVYDGDVVYLAMTGFSGFLRATRINSTQFTVPQIATTTTVSTMQWLPHNNYYWRWRLYRSQAGVWQMVDEITLDKITYTDAKPASALGDPPTSYYADNGQTVDFDKAPLSLTGIESHYGMLFGIQGHSVRWTPTLQPDAWPETFSVTLGYQPVALASFAQGLIILCEDAIYRLDGNTPTGMSLSKTYAEDGCFAPHSVQKTDKGLIYLAKRGIMLFDGARAECLTDTRIPGTTLTAPSRLTTAYPFWWMPTIMTRAYADLAGEESIKGDQYSFTLDNTRTIEGYNKYIKSFYHLGAYYLFYSGTDYAANTAFVVDLQVPGLPISTLGMKALDAHVDEFENAYVLFDNAAPVTTVTITSPV